MGRPKGSKNKDVSYDRPLTLEEKDFIKNIIPLCVRLGMDVHICEQNVRVSWENKRPIYRIDGVKYNIRNQEDRQLLIRYICLSGLPEPNKTVDLRKRFIRKGDRIWMNF